MIGNPLLLPDEGYNISRSVRLRSSASGYFNRTPTSNGSRTTWTWSGWVKRGALSSNNLFSAGLISGTFYYTILGFGSDQLVFANYNDTNAGWLTTTQVFRDPSAWYHVVAVFDSTNATSTDRMRLYVNGNRITAFSTGTFPTTYPAQNTTSQMNTTSYTKWVGSYVRNGGSGSTFDGYLTEINFIDGQALTPSSFGETDVLTGVWKPKKYTGTYGTNGFFLNFSDPSASTATTIGKDYSGNGNNWAPTNISVTAGSTYDSMLDVPTLWADGGNGRGNYCTWNPLQVLAGSALDGNLNVDTTNSIGSTLAVSSGKWYFETTPSYLGASDWYNIGIFNIATAFTASTARGASSASYVYRSDGFKRNSGTATSYGTSYTTGDVIGVAFDLDAGTLTFYKNNTSQGTAYTGLSGTFMCEIGGPGGQIRGATNFGQRPFAYSPPTGFKALNTQNLPAPTIVNGAAWMAATTYTGTNASLTISNAVNGVSMQPDLVWVKARSQADQNVLCDSVRGVTRRLYSNLTNAEDATGGLVSINSSGFVLGDAATSQSMNNSGQTYVAWQWKEGATPGFDIVTYSGTGSVQTVSHSLGVAPSMMIVKSRSTAGTDWAVYHRSLGGTKVMVLNSTTAAITIAGSWNNTDPTSSVFTVGTGSGSGDTNGSGRTYVNYLFAEVAGFSKAFSYTGNGSTDGPFVFCGFRPRWVMIKRSDGVGEWGLLDTAMNTYNVAINSLQANTSDAQISNSDRAMDFLSNGFKIRNGTTFNVFNVNGGTYVGIAFAETPFRNSLAR
jgi:hypothetical protein